MAPRRIERIEPQMERFGALSEFAQAGFAGVLDLGI